MKSSVSLILILLLIFTLPKSVNAAPIRRGISVPSVPRNLMATVLANSISLTWTPSSNNGGSAITGYKIYRGTSTGAESSTPIIIVRNITSIFDNSASDGTTYFYMVKATNSAGDSSPSNEASAMVPVTGSLPIMPLAGSLFIIILMLALLVTRRRRATPKSEDA